MATDADIKARAEARFRRSEEMRSAAAAVTADVERAKAAERAKTERLRALRLAKEAADRDAVASVPKAAAKAGAGSPAPRSRLKGR